MSIEHFVFPQPQETVRPQVNTKPDVYLLAAKAAKAEPCRIPPSVRNGLVSLEEAYRMGYRQALAENQNRGAVPANDVEGE